MKKQLAMVTLLSTVAVGMFATTANAAPGDDKVQRTEVGIEFDSDKGTTEGEGPFKDNLAISHKPRAFEFGKQTAIGASKTFNNTITKEQYIIVNDDRVDGDDGTRSAWELKANLSELKSTTTADPLVSTLTYELEQAKGYFIGDQVDQNTNDYVKPLPDPEDSTSEAFGPKAPTITANDKIVLGDTADFKATNMSLVAGDATSKRVMAKTESNKFRGGVAAKVTKTKLTVPNSSAAAGHSYKGTVTWTLTDSLSK